MNRVLVADDQSVTRDLVARALKDLGVSDVICAADGRQASALLEKTEFDLVILDWHMPFVEGPELVRALRGRGSRVPVLMVTAEADKEHVLEAIRTGVTDYLIKPLNYVALRRKLQAYCQEKARVPELETLVDKDVVTILADTYIGDAVETLVRHATNSLPVVNSQNRLVGLISEFQVLHAAFSPRGKQRTVRDVMTKEVATVTRETSLDAVLKMMEQRKVGQIPVLHNGQFIGVVTPRAILRHALRTGLPGTGSHPGVPADTSASVSKTPKGSQVSASPPEQLGFASVESYTETQNRAAQRVLDTIDRVSERTEDIHSQLRGSKRHKVRTVITLCIAGSRETDSAEAPAQIFQAWAADLSAGGLALIYPGWISERHLCVGIPLPDESLSWFCAEIVREREIPGEGFWEFGVAFRERLRAGPDVPLPE